MRWHARRRAARRPASWLFGVAAVTAALLACSAGPASAAGVLPPANPRSNVAPVPDYLSSGLCTVASGDGGAVSCVNPCVAPSGRFYDYTDSVPCSQYVLRAIDGARRTEQLGALVLPRNWYHLSAPEQLFVLADLERVARGLPPYLGINAALAAEAERAARGDRDPGLARGFAVGLDHQGAEGFGGAWSGGASTTLAADFGWMYSDGWGGSVKATSNIACTSASSPACWAHRDELLGFDPRFDPGVGLRCADCEMGTGFAITRGFSSYVDLVELPSGTPPPMTFSWARNVVPYLGREAPPARASSSGATRYWSESRAADSSGATPSRRCARWWWTQRAQIAGASSGSSASSSPSPSPAATRAGAPPAPTASL
jgi:hypothetical protein